MSRINIIKREQTSGALAQSLNKIKSKFGVLPNSLATFANTPAVLNGYLAFSEALSGGELDARQRKVLHWLLVNLTAVNIVSQHIHVLVKVLD